MKFLLKKGFLFILLGLLFLPLSFANNQNLRIKVKGVVIKLYNKPRKEQQEQIRRILKDSGLAETQSSDIAQRFRWSTGGLRLFHVGEKACKKVTDLSFVKSCFIHANENQCYQLEGFTICQKLFDSSETQRNRQREKMEKAVRAHSGIFL